ncbi:hypothetical protein NQ314_018059 [Rhamnusium bicolor]|uniref:MADF domain-containing protein n=1 Tax=Rhamnusium bicolor TaxID=1586634 RepID=A0AAV8WS64_9CUCU|nr:hypothetical protein NQ314_018059 [Rhamnusium bicolor]
MGESQEKIWDVDVGLLIKLVQNFPHIYDHGHKSFKNNTLRENTWAKIAATLKWTIVCEYGKNVRDKYTRERRAVMSQPADGPVLSKWDFYDAMEFLNPYIKRRRTLTVRKRPNFISVQTVDAKDSLRSPSSSSSNSKLWDPVAIKLSPESFSLLEEDFDDGSGEMEEITTFETEIIDDTPREIKEVIEQPSTINIVRHQTSEEAFGAYIATRLMELPPEIRQIKKAKLFKDLEDPEEVS